MITQESLPLFSPELLPELLPELAAGFSPEKLPAASRGGQSERTWTDSARTKRHAQRRRFRDAAEAAVVNPHLQAARKLSNKIKYLPDHSDVQTRTGQAICQHLRLMLSELRVDQPGAGSGRASASADSDRIHPS